MSRYVNTMLLAKKQSKNKEEKMIDPMVEAEKIRSRTNLLIAIISIIGTLIMSPMLTNWLSSLIDNKNCALLYSEVYFSRMQDDILAVPVEIIQMELEKDILSGNGQYTEKDWFDKMMSPYEVLQLVLTRYKSQKYFNNIPDSYIEEMNTFLDKKITEDRQFLSKIESVDHIKSFLLAIQKAVIRREKELDRIYGLPSEFQSIELVELQKNTVIEFTGIFWVHRNILADYLTTSEYITHCKEEFDKRIKN